MQGGPQRLIPAAVLALDKRAQLRGVAFEGLLRCHTIRADLVVAVFNALHDAGDADFDKFVEIRGGDGEEFHPLEQGIARIFGFLQNTAVEAQPGLIAAEEKLLPLWLSCRHKGEVYCWKTFHFIQDTRPRGCERRAKIVAYPRLTGGPGVAEDERTTQTITMAGEWRYRERNPDSHP